MDIIKQMSHVLLNFDWRSWLHLFLNCLTEIFFRFLWPSSYLQDLDKKAVFITGKFSVSLSLSLISHFLQDVIPDLVILWLCPSMSQAYMSLQVAFSLINRELKIL